MNPCTSIQDKGTGGSVSIVEKESKRKCKTCHAVKAITEFDMYRPRAGQYYRRHSCHACELERRNMSKYWKRYDAKHQVNNDLLRNWK